VPYERVVNVLLSAIKIIDRRAVMAVVIIGMGTSKRLSERRLTMAYEKLHTHPQLEDQLGVPRSHVIVGASDLVEAREIMAKYAKLVKEPASREGDYNPYTWHD